MKNLKRNSVILLLITAVVLFFILKDDYQDIVNALSNANIIFILIGMVFSVSYWFFKSLSLHNIVREYKKSISLKRIFKQITITQFFNGITPFASGGQPMQIYMLGKSGLKFTHSTNIIVQDFILYQMALITHGVIAVLLNLKLGLVESNPLLINLTVVGFIINTLVGVGLLFVSFSTKFNKFVVNKVIGLFSKIKIVKNKEKTIESWKIKLKEFNESAVLLREKKSLIIKGYIYNIIGLACYYLTPLFVIYALGFGDSITMISTYVCCAYVSIIGAFVPLPGGSGGIEGSFLEFFGNFMAPATTKAVLILWRSITYYLAIIVGAITFNTFKGVKEKCE
jgi:uncharacterized protein (TIRG00374 family)